jgi:hypothetical protein
VLDRSFVLGGPNLGVRAWEGRFEKTFARWPRFTGGAGRLSSTGEERADAESARGRFAAKLRAHGVDPDQA